MFLRKRNNVLLIIGIIILAIIIVFFYRSFTRKLVEANVTNINISKHFDYVFNEHIVGDISDYATLIFEIDIKNISSEFNIIDINIDPLIPPTLKDKVVWYNTGDDAAYSEQMQLKPTKVKKYFRYLLIKKDSLDDNQLIDLFKSIKFNISYFSFDNKSTLTKYLTIGYSKFKTN